MVLRHTFLRDSPKGTADWQVSMCTMMLPIVSLACAHRFTQLIHQAGFGLRILLNEHPRHACMRLMREFCTQVVAPGACLPDRHHNGDEGCYDAPHHGHNDPPIEVPLHMPCGVMLVSFIAA